MPKKKTLSEEIINDFETGKMKRSKRVKQEMKIAKEAASNFLKKNARINIRISKPDLNLLKRKAAEEGMPYQTLIASLLHKFVAGRLLMGENRSG